MAPPCEWLKWRLWSQKAPCSNMWWMTEKHTVFKLSASSNLSNLSLFISYLWWCVIVSKFGSHRLNSKRQSLTVIYWMLVGLHDSRWLLASEAHLSLSVYSGTMLQVCVMINLCFVASCWTKVSGRPVIGWGFSCRLFNLWTTFGWCSRLTYRY